LGPMYSKKKEVDSAEGSKERKLSGKKRKIPKKRDDWGASSARDSWGGSGRTLGGLKKKKRDEGNSRKKGKHQKLKGERTK